MIITLVLQRSQYLVPMASGGLPASSEAETNASKIEQFSIEMWEQFGQLVLAALSVCIPLLYHMLDRVN